MELAKREEKAATVYSEEEVRLIKDQICKDANLNDNELKVYLRVASHKRLDVFSGQIHAVRRGDKMIIQTGIDGFRLIADRSGSYVGRVKTEWIDVDGVPSNHWNDDMPPAACKVWVRKRMPDGSYQDIEGTANYTEYVQKSNAGEVTYIWRSRPAGQLEKCAEAIALRAGWPQDLAGMYVDVEMEQADNPRGSASVQQPRRKSESQPTGEHEAEVCEVVQGQVTEISQKTGTTKNGKQWTKHGIQIEGEWYGTFSETAGQIAWNAKDTGELVSLEWKPNDKNPKYRDVVSIRELIEEPPE